MSRSIVVFGITGSIGASTVKILRAFPDRFRLIGASAGKNIGRLNEIIPFFPSLKAVALTTPSLAAEVRGPDVIRRDSGEEGAMRLLDLSPDMVVMALGGKAGWRITLEALRRGIPVALANKESLVIAGCFLGRTATADRTKLIPIDSEHAALMQLLAHARPDHIRRACITASGGALLNLSREEMMRADIARTLDHPVWSMGKKVTVDSATMVNKGLELIEAYWLFPLRPDQLGAIVHPEVTIHAVVEFIDGTALSQMAVSDMAIPIAAALAYPDMLPLTDKFPQFTHRLDRSLSFREPDLEKYSLLKLALELLQREDYAGMVAYAISDETAVDAFLAGELSIGGLHRVVERTVERFGGERPPVDIDGLAAFIAEVERYAAAIRKEVTS